MFALWRNSVNDEPYSLSYVATNILYNTLDGASPSLAESKLCAILVDHSSVPATFSNKTSSRLLVTRALRVVSFERTNCHELWSTVVYRY